MLPAGTTLLAGPDQWLRKAKPWPFGHDSQEQNTECTAPRREGLKQPRAETDKEDEARNPRAPLSQDWESSFWKSLENLLSRRKMKMRKSLGFLSVSQRNVEDPKVGRDPPQAVQDLCWDPLFLLPLLCTLLTPRTYRSVLQPPDDRPLSLLDPDFPRGRYLSHCCISRVPHRAWGTAGSQLVFVE